MLFVHETIDVCKLECLILTTSESFEFGINDFAIVVNLNLQPHDVSTLWRPNQAGTHSGRALIQCSNITWIFIVIDYLNRQLKISHRTLN